MSITSVASRTYRPAYPLQWRTPTSCSQLLRNIAAWMPRIHIKHIHLLRVIAQSDAYNSRQKVKQTQSQNPQPIIGIPSAFEENSNSTLRADLQWSLVGPWPVVIAVDKPCKRSFVSLVCDSCELILGILLWACRSRSLGMVLTRPYPGVTCHREQTVSPRADARGHG